MELSDDQLAFLEGQIQKRGIKMPSLAEDLLDHFACAIEREMNSGKSFDDAYNKVYLEICPDGLKEIEDQAHYLLTLNQQMIMKKVVFLVGFIAAFIYVVGTTFKVMHWPMANILLMTGSIIFGLGFLPGYFISKYNWDKKSGKDVNLPVSVLNFSFWFLVIITVLWRHMHWPWATEMMVLSMLSIGFVLLPQVFRNWYKRHAA